jgi:hypothetical protein
LATHTRRRQAAAVEQNQRTLRTKAVQTDSLNTWATFNDKAGKEVVDLA